MIGTDSGPIALRGTTNILLKHPKLLKEIVLFHAHRVFEEAGQLGKLVPFSVSQNKSNDDDRNTNQRICYRHELQI